MSAIVTLSDSSDDSDDLPSFAERVKRLVDAEDKDNRNPAPKQKSMSIHPISDSEDSRDTIPFARSRSVSPVFNLPEFLNCNSGNKNDNINLDDNIPDLNHRKTTLPSFSLDIKKSDSNKINGAIGSSDNLLCLNYKNVSKPYNEPECSEYNINMRNVSISSDEDISPKNVKIHKEKRSNKDEEKEMKKKIRLEKKKEKELMKVLKASEKEIKKNQKPEELLKNMKIVLDHNILYLEGSQSTLNVLDQNNLQYSIEENKCKYCVNWYRKVVNISTENHEVLREEREELTDTLVMIIPNEDFLRMVCSYVQKAKGKSSDYSSLAEYIINIKSLYPSCEITGVTIGFQKFMRNIKEEGSFDLKSLAKQVHKNASEEAIIELQLQSSVSFNFLDNMSEFGNLLHHFTKAIAEAPQRKEKQIQKALAFSWYADIDSHCPIKLSKDGSSFIKLWQQQVQQFQNVGPEVAEAIVSRYPSPRLLLKAYKRCVSTKDAENLLQDIVVRRNYGPLGTQKRIGPELSYKFHLFFTSRDGDKLLKR